MTTTRYNVPTIEKVLISIGYQLENEIMFQRAFVHEHLKKILLNTLVGSYTREQVIALIIKKAPIDKDIFFKRYERLRPDKKSNT